MYTLLWTLIFLSIISMHGAESQLAAEPLLPIAGHVSRSTESAMWADIENKVADLQAVRASDARYAQLAKDIMWLYGSYSEIDAALSWPLTNSRVDACTCALVGGVGVLATACYAPWYYGVAAGAAAAGTCGACIQMKDRPARLALVRLVSERALASAPQVQSME